MPKKVKQVTDEQFNRLVGYTIPRMNTSQVDRLWEVIRLDIRRRFYNQGLEGAAAAVTQVGQAIKPAEPDLAAAFAGAIRAKTWAPSLPNRSAAAGKKRTR